MVLAKLTHQQVIGSLRATGSTDKDVLFARKEDLLQETHRLKLLTIVPIVLGTILSISIVGAIIGVPMIFFGLSVKKSYQHNLKVSEEAYQQYLASLRSGSAA